MSQSHDPTVNEAGDAQPRTRSRLWLNAVLICGGVAVLLAFLLPMTRSVRPTTQRNSCAVNLKNISLALQQYHSMYHALPPAYTVDADGKPLHSWRTLILPFLDQRPLYESIDLSKAWDDPANAVAYHAKAPEIFRCPASGCPEDHTTYLAPVTPTSCLRPAATRSLSDITDGLSKTLLVIEAPQENAVHWMAPVDADEAVVLNLGPESKLAHNGGVNVAFCDGRVLFLRDSLPKEKWQALISIAGNDDATDED